MARVFIVTDQRSGEPDIVSPVQDQPLRLEGAGLQVATCPAPTGGWIRDALQVTADTLCREIPDGHVIDAFVGGTWVGSTEV